MAAKKTVGNYTDVGQDGGFSSGKDTISFEEDIEDFAPKMGASGGGEIGEGDADAPITVDTTGKEIDLGKNLMGRYGSIWYKGDSDIANCIEGKCNLGKGFRAYFEFQFDCDGDNDNSVYGQDEHAESKGCGDGFTFSLISGYEESLGNFRNTADDTGSGGEYIGYAGPGLDDGLQPPKIGIEFDTYPNEEAGDICGSNSRRDNTPVANHLAAVYWGEETPGSFDATGGWLSLGTEDWSNNTVNCDTGWCGTLSFWFKRDTISYGGSSSGDRLWGQHGNMEMRFSSTGSSIVLDWGGDPLTFNNPFTRTDTWYFVAISWATDKAGPNTDGRLRFSYYDSYWDDFEHNFAEDNYWNPPLVFWPSGVIENLFMNSSGGDGAQNFQVDGQGKDLRYYNAEIHTWEDVREIWNNTRPTAPDSYHPLQADTIDSSTGLSASIVGSAGWSADTPSIFDCGTNADTYDDNRHGTGGITTPMNSLNSDNTNGNDGYHQVTGSSPNWLEDGLPHLFRIELIRPLLDDPLGSGFYKYQFKVWILDETDLTPTELAQFKDVRADFSAFSPLIQKTIKDTNNPLVLDTANHDQLKRILFGFTQATGGATQNITLRDLELYFLRQYPVSDLATW